MPLLGRKAGAQRATQPPPPAAPPPSATAAASSASSGQDVQFQLNNLKDIMSQVEAMLQEPPSEDMVPMVDMFLGEAHAQSEALQAQADHVAEQGQYDLMEQIVLSTSQREDLQQRADDWKLSARQTSHDAHGTAVQHSEGAGESDEAMARRLAEEETRQHEEAQRLQAQEEARRQEEEEEEAARRQEEAKEREEAKRREEAEAAKRHEEAEAARRREEEETARRLELAEAARRREEEEEDARRAEAEAARLREEADLARRRLEQEEEASRREEAEAARRREEEEAARHREEAEATRRREEEEARKREEEDAAKRQEEQNAVFRQQQQQQQLQEATRKRLVEGIACVAGRVPTTENCNELRAAIQEAIHVGVDEPHLEVARVALTQAEHDFQQAKEDEDEARKAEEAQREVERRAEEEAREAERREFEAQRQAEEAQREAERRAEEETREAERRADDERREAERLAVEQARREQEALLRRQAELLGHLQDAAHSGDTFALKRAIDEAREGGVPEAPVSWAEAHLVALQFLLRRPEYQAGPYLREWHIIASQMRVERQEAARRLKEQLRNGAPAEELEQEAVRATELEVDHHIVDLVHNVAGNRRNAHQQAQRALKGHNLHELDAAKAAVEAAGGPAADIPLLDAAIDACEEDAEMLEEWEVGIPVAVSRFLRQLENEAREERHWEQSLQSRSEKRQQEQRRLEDHRRVQVEHEERLNREAEERRRQELQEQEAREKLQEEQQKLELAAELAKRQQELKEAEAHLAEERRRQSILAARPCVSRARKWLVTSPTGGPVRSTAVLKV